MLLSLAATAQTATTPGAISTPFPTFEQLTVEWAITGDSDLDATVAVRQRVQGSQVWVHGLPLRRTPAGNNLGFSWGNRFSGSVFGLRPGTRYELELTLTDPDGGDSVQLLTASTRSRPQPMAGAPVIAVTPANLAEVLANANPGQILEFGPGNYPGFILGRDGSAGMPIVLRGTAEAVINGEIGLFQRQHVMLQGLKVNGRIRFNGSSHVSVLGCTVNASPVSFNGDGIVSFLRAENAWIADNTVTGTSLWAESSLGASGNNRGEGILVTGPGHVIEYNRVRGFRDNISLLEDSEARDQFSIDIVGNELSEAADDAVEADFCFHNCRITGNRVSNAFIGFSSQPGLGGPTWFVRNSGYNVAHIGFKLYRNSSGDVLLHNTIVKAGDALGMYPGVPVSRLYARNNLFLGGAGSTVNGFSNGSGRVLSIEDLVVATADLNHNAYGSNLATFNGRFGAIQFNSLAQLRSLTSETAAVQIDLAGFAAGIGFPANVLTQFLPADLRLGAGSAAIDAGQILPGLNEGFVGTGPDAGAYEFGQALPQYGPRAASDGLFSNGFEN